MIKDEGASMDYIIANGGRRIFESKTSTGQFEMWEYCVKKDIDEFFENNKQIYSVIFDILEKYINDRERKLDICRCTDFSCCDYINLKDEILDAIRKILEADSKQYLDGFEYSVYSELFNGLFDLGHYESGIIKEKFDTLINSSFEDELYEIEKKERSNRSGSKSLYSYLEEKAARNVAEKLSVVISMWYLAELKRLFGLGKSNKEDFLEQGRGIIREALNKQEGYHKAAEKGDRENRIENARDKATKSEEQFVEAAENELTITSDQEQE